MSKEFYEDDCEDCQPSMIDGKTGLFVPPDSPMLLAVRAEFKKSSRAEKLAWHNITCSNSRDPDDVQIVSKLMKRLKEAANQATK